MQRPGGQPCLIFQRAIELDPNFAMAYETLGIAYENIGQPERAKEYHAKTFQLREHASARERMEITTDYCETITGELDKAVRAYQELIATYPQHTENWKNNLALVYGKQGQYEKEAEIFIQLVRDWPKDGTFWGALAQSTLDLQRLDETRQVIREMQARKMDTASLRYALYALAFIGADSTAMSEQLLSNKRLMAAQQKPASQRQKP
jgi:tetratricopeptide (TPR) repeat protein